MIRTKYCMVPLCTNNSQDTPNKLLITVPQDVAVREKWRLAMKENIYGKKFADKTVAFVCEDHFDLQEDMDNYMEYKIMGRKFSKIRMKKGVVPHKFECQDSGRTPSDGTQTTDQPGTSEILSPIVLQTVPQLLIEEPLYQSIPIEVPLPKIIVKNNSTNVVNVQTTQLREKRRTNLYLTVEDSPQRPSSSAETESMDEEFVSTPSSSSDFIPGSKENQPKTTQVVTIVQYLKSFKLPIPYDEKIQIKIHGRPTPDMNLHKIHKFARNAKGPMRYNRYFNKEWYQKCKWMCGCEATNKIYCFPCLIETENNSFTDGVTDLTHLSELAKKHSISKQHLKAELEYSLLPNVTHTQKTVDPLAHQQRENVRKNKQMLSNIIDFLKFSSFSKFPLFLKKHQSKTDLFNELLKLYCEIDKSEVTEIFINKGGIEEMFNQLLFSMSLVIQNCIKKEISKADFVSFVVEDISSFTNEFQIALFFRYVTQEGEINERFWGFLKPEDKTVSSLNTALEKVLTTVLDNPRKLISQSYDGGSFSYCISDIDVEERGQEDELKGAQPSKKAKRDGVSSKGARIVEEVYIKTEFDETMDNDPSNLINKNIVEAEGLSNTANDPLRSNISDNNIALTVIKKEKEDKCKATDLNESGSRIIKLEEVDLGILSEFGGEDHLEEEFLDTTNPSVSTIEEPLQPQVKKQSLDPTIPTIGDSIQPEANKQSVTSIAKIIRKKYNLAYLIPCYIHDLDAIFAQIACKDPSIRLFFANLQRVCTFFGDFSEEFGSSTYLGLLSYEGMSWNIKYRLETIHTHFRKLVETLNSLQSSTFDFQSLSKIYTVKMILEDETFGLYLKICRHLINIAEAFKNHLEDGKDIKKFIPNVAWCTDELRKKRKRPNEINFKSIVNDIMTQMQEKYEFTSYRKFEELVEITNFCIYSQKFPSSLLKNVVNAYPEVFNDKKLKNELEVVYSKDILKRIPSTNDLLKFLVGNDLQSAFSETFLLLQIVVLMKQRRIMDSEQSCVFIRVKKYLNKSLEIDQEQLPWLVTIAAAEDLIKAKEDFNCLVTDKFSKATDTEVHFRCDV